MEIKQLHEADFATGMEFEAELAEAREKLNTATQVYLRFLGNLRKRYDAPEGAFDLNDWAVGFVPIEGVSNGENN